jgi:hypothetical protein
MNSELDNLKSRLQDARNRLFKLDNKRFFCGSESRRRHVRDEIIAEIMWLRKEIEKLETGKA